jgi:hypothetical protein
MGETPTIYEWAGGTEAFEWGSRLAVHNSAPDADDIVTEAPVPRWGWGIAPPYQG